MSGGELEPVSRAELRASHEDRDMIVDELRIAAGDGRIDADELDQRIEAALNARTYGELDVLVKDLPQSTEAQARSVAKRAEAEASQTITVAHANTRKNGAWLVPRELVVTGGHSNVVLDFTEAVFHGPREVHVVLDARHSNIRMIMPDGSHADTSRLSMRHANVSQRNMGPASPEAVRVTISGQAAHANVKVMRLSRFARWRRAKREQKALGAR